MKCKLCDRPIKNYNATFNNLKMDETHSVDICSDCVDKFTKWQGSIIVNLFPSRAMKRRAKK